MNKERTAAIAVLSLFIGIGAVGALVLSGLGVRWDLWSYRTGLTILRWAAWSGLGILALSLIAGFYVTSGRIRRGLAYATVGGFFGILVFAIPASNLSKARSVPPIHDITTDTNNPPIYVDIVEVRKKVKARNSIVYAGPKIAALQKEAYPDIAPLETNAPVRKVFDTALSVATDLGWLIVSSVPERGRIEATDTTFWFGFKDDVVIRIARLGNKSRIDVRSTSRVGRSDVGTNAARICRFISAMETRLNQ
jgi:uncharacterized protein (DUF1499 family)